MATTDPELAAEWSLNNSCEPDSVMRNYRIFVFWVCPKCHGEYRAKIHERAVGDDSCPFCAGTRTLRGFNDLTTTDPELVMEWSPNNRRRPTTVRKQIKTYALWNCPTCGGEYRYPVNEREVGDDSCPYCNKNSVFPGFNDLLTTNPELAMQWSSNNERGAETVRKSFRLYALWICLKCGGEYSAIIKDRESGDHACPYCSGAKLLPGYNDLGTVDPDLASEWSTNNNRAPNSVMKSYSLTARWTCQTCGGEYSCPINERKVGDDACPYCNADLILAGYNDLLTTDPKLAAEWSPNNSRAADTVRKSNRFPARWICPECHGEYRAMISEREVDDDSCPYCNGRKAFPGVNTFKVKHPDLMEEWLELENSLLDVDPDNIIDNNSVYVWWKCRICDYKYTMSVRERLMKQRRGHNPCTYCNGRRIIISHFI